VFVVPRPWQPVYSDPVAESSKTSQALIGNASGIVNLRYEEVSLVEQYNTKTRFISHTS
jgi:hypothetical protein